ncbi:MAG: energy-coupling factor ABC transporter ATP-binding protein [Desulfitobacteriaceae bacterium]
MSRGSAITVENLNFSYSCEGISILKNISFSLEYGEVLGIMGPTGAGKTTLAMCLNSLIPQVIPGEISGKIRVDGKDVFQHEVSEMSVSVGFVFQEPENQLSQMSVEEEVAFGIGNLGVPREEMIGRITESLATVGLAGFEKRNPLALSGGQQQRLAIASVLAMRPPIMILDEPTSMLDPIGKNEVFDVLRQLKANNITGIIIDHEVERLATYCDKIMVIYDGEIKMFGAPREVLLNLKQLHAMKLKAPQVTELTERLRKEAGFKLDYPTTLNEAIEIYSALSFNK